MKNYRVISKVILTICLCGIVLAVINGFTGIINNSIQISGTIICISAFVVASVTIILLGASCEISIADFPWRAEEIL